MPKPVAKPPALPDVKEYGKPKRRQNKIDRLASDAVKKWIHECCLEWVENPECSFSWEKLRLVVTEHVPNGVGKETLRHYVEIQHPDLAAKIQKMTARGGPS